MFNYNLTSLIFRSKRGLQFISLRGFTSTNSREALVKCLSMCPRYAALKLSTRVCALHCDLPLSPGIIGVSQFRTQSRLRIISFNYVMTKNVPAMHLVAHGKSSTLYGRSYGRKSKFFRLDGLLLFCIIMVLRCARCEPRYKNIPLLITVEQLRK